MSESCQNPLGCSQPPPWGFTLTGALDFCKGNEVSFVTCVTVECADGAWELICVASAVRTVVACRAYSGSIIQDYNAHGVVTEVAGRACLAHPLRHLVLVCSVLTPDGIAGTSLAVVAHRTSEINIFFI